MNTTKVRFLLAAVALAMLPFSGARLMSAAPVCVTPGGGHGCLASINAAIAAAPAGSTITISKGHYTENVAVDKSVTLAGAGEGNSDDVVIVPAVSGPNPATCAGGSLCAGASNIILVQADNVTIRNLTLDGDNPYLTSGIVRDGADLDARNGIIVDFNFGAGIFNNLTVANVTVRNVYLRGIYASSGGTFNFHNNTVTNVQGDGNSVAMFNFGGSGFMTSNAVSEANDAISSNWSSGTQYVDNEVRQSGSGVHTDNNGGFGFGVGDLIQGNRVTDGATGAYGIFVFVPYLPVTVKDNVIDGVDVGLAAFGSAAAVTTNFVNNDVTGHPKTGSAGVFVTTDELGFGQSDVATQFDSNQVSGFQTGFVIESDPTAAITVTASCNAVDHDPGQAVRASGLAAAPGGGAQHLSFDQNNLDGKGVGIENNGLGVIDGASNWWGCKGGPGAPGCATVVGTVAYTPWLNEPSKCARDKDHK
jgi:hypothetical protein